MSVSSTTSTISGNTLASDNNFFSLWQTSSASQFAESILKCNWRIIVGNWSRSFRY